MTHRSWVEDSSLKLTAGKQIKDGEKDHDGLTRFAIRRLSSYQKAKELASRASPRGWWGLCHMTVVALSPGAGDFII